MKHTDMKTVADQNQTFNTETAPLSVNVTKSSSPAVISGSNIEIPFKVTLANTSATQLVIDSIEDVASEAGTVLNSSVKFHSATWSYPISDSGPVAGTTKWIFSGPFTVPANTSRVLEYKMQVPCTAGTTTSLTYENGVVAKIGTTVVGSSSTQSQKVSINVTVDSSCAITSQTSEVTNESLGTQVTTGAVKNVTSNQAIVTGTVDSNGVSGIPVTCLYSTDVALAGASAVTARIPAGGVTTNAADAQVVECDLNGLLPDTEYFYRVKAGDALGEILSFRTPPTALAAPTIATLTPSGVIFESSTGKATLRGQVNPGGQQSRVRFVRAQVTDINCTSPTSVTYHNDLQQADAESETIAGPLELGGSYEVEFDFPVTGLSNNTWYCYQAIVDYNFNGTSYTTTALGSSVSFKVTANAAPTVVTLPASSVAGDSATLNGTVTKGGLNANAYFCYTTSAPVDGQIVGCAANKVAATPATVTATGDTSIALSATGLQPGSKYYFQALATDVDNTAIGVVESFVTPGPPIAETNDATAVKSASATINGYVTANGASTDVYFCFSTSNAITSGLMDHCETGNTVSPTLVSQIGPSEAAAKSANLEGLVAETTYYFQVIAKNSNGTSYGSVKEFKTLGAPILPAATTSSVSEPTSKTAKLNGLVNAGNDDTSVNFCYGEASDLSDCTLVSGSPSVVTGNTNTSVYYNLTGLRGSRTYYYRVSATNPSGSRTGLIESFVTPDEPPTAVTNDPPTYSQTAASLSGVVNPGSKNATVSFCVATSSAVTDGALNCWKVVEFGSINNGSLNSYSDDVTATADVTGLSNNTSYWYQVIVYQTGGTIGYGNVKFFKFGKTPPGVTTLDATSITTNSALLNGSIGGGSEDADIKFCFGTSPSLASCTEVAADPASVSQSDSVSASYEVTGLTPGTTYYFKALASDSDAVVEGDILSFSTEIELSSSSTDSPAPSSDPEPEPTPDPAPKLCTPTAETLGNKELGLIGVIGRLFSWVATTISGALGQVLEPVMNSSIGAALLSTQPVISNPLLGSQTLPGVEETTIAQMFKAAGPAPKTNIDPESIELVPGENEGEFEVQSETGETLQLLDSTFVDYRSQTIYSGSDFNNPATWQALGYGAMCWKLEPFSDSDYFFTLPFPLQLPAGAKAGDWEYSHVMVKAGSLTASSADYQTDTVYAAPKPGERVFADINANGIFDPGGKNGDKAISHIIICAKLKTAPTPTPTAEGTPTSSPSPTTDPTSSPSPSPTESSTESPSPTPTTAAPTPTPTLTPEALQGEDCIWPEPTSSPKIADPEPTKSPEILISVSPLSPITQSPTPGPTAPPTGPTTGPTTPPSGTDEPVTELNPTTPCQPSGDLTVALLLTNGTSTLCYKTTSLALFNVAFAPFQADEEPLFTTQDGDEDGSGNGNGGPKSLADTGFESGLLAMLAILMAGAGFFVLRRARRRV
jgi:phosphodiesterase/alkaline phosphatase D-like protein